MTVILDQSIRGYQLLELIGEGAYGAVYRARQEFIECELAIKIIQRDTIKDPTERYPSAMALVEDYWRDLQLNTFFLEEEIFNPYKSLHPFQETDCEDFFG